MNFAVLTNIVTAIFCLAVLVQSVRMMRALNAMKDGGLSDVVAALDGSTAQARIVLADLKAALGQCAVSERALVEGKEISEELGVMVGIANATAERLLEASGTANRKAAEAWNSVSDYVDVEDAGVDDGALAPRDAVSA